jgi:hypothetical protein
LIFLLHSLCLIEFNYSLSKLWLLKSLYFGMFKFEAIINILNFLFARKFNSVIKRSAKIDVYLVEVKVMDLFSNVRYGYGLKFLVGLRCIGLLDIIQCEGKF